MKAKMLDEDVFAEILAKVPPLLVMDRENDVSQILHLLITLYERDMDLVRLYGDGDKKYLTAWHPGKILEDINERFWKKYQERRRVVEIVGGRPANPPPHKFP